MWRDLERLFQHYDIPFLKPNTFPKNGLHAVRIATVATSEGWCPAFTRAVFSANFAAVQDIADSDVLSAIIKSIGQDSQRVFEYARSPDNKNRLRELTDEGANLGIFGAPSFIANGELFWGDDRLEQAVEWLKKST